MKSKLTVKQLREILSNLDDNAIVLISNKKNCKLASVSKIDIVNPNCNEIHPLEKQWERDFQVKFHLGINDVTGGSRFYSSRKSFNEEAIILFPSNT